MGSRASARVRSRQEQGSDLRRSAYQSPLVTLEPETLIHFAAECVRGNVFCGYHISDKLKRAEDFRRAVVESWPGLPRAMALMPAPELRRVGTAYGYRGDEVGWTRWGFPVFKTVRLISGDQFRTVVDLVAKVQAGAVCGCPACSGGQQK
jgi:hypothetical protein